jgi:multiple sugar transport system permease protein
MAAIDVPSSQVTLAKKKRRTGIEREEAKWGFIFIAPWIFGFIVFTFFPILASLFFSLTNYNPIHIDQMQFLGIDNYIRMFSDPLIGQSVMVTLKFAIISVPLGLAIPLGLAVLVNSKNLFGKNFFRTLFYLPYMIPVVAGVVVWGGILNSSSGWLNLILKNVFGIIGPSWFQDENWVIPALVIMGFWGVGNTMLIMLSGLQNVPTELYEAATVDGAGAIRKFFSITVPMITPIIFYNLVLALIGSFQYFTQAYIISNGRGDPNFATLFYNLYLYQQSFSYLNMGYGCAMAWAMFIVVILLTVVLFSTSRRWVYYASGD